MPRFVPRQRKHKVRRRDTVQDGSNNSNTNQIQILPQSKEEKEGTRRKLKEELRAGQSNISSKKQKRLDKYIDTKLKKDENLDLIKKLSQAKFDTSQLQSSKHLGKRKHAQYAADIDPRKKDLADGNRKPDDSDESDLESTDSFGQQHEHSSSSSFEPRRQNQDLPLKPVVMQGSGLRQPLEVDSNGLPVIHNKRKKAKRKSIEDDCWEGFGTESDAEVQSPKHCDDMRYGGLVAGSTTDIDEESAEDLDFSTTDSSESGYESSPDGDDAGGKIKIAPRVSAFKSWATQQINESLGHVPFQGRDCTQPSKPVTATVQTIVPTRAPDVGMVQEERKDGLGRKICNVPVTRTAEIGASREKLPIVAEEQKIMEAIHNNPCVIVWGTTGSGKTTQVPQFLFEAGYGSHDSSTPGIIGITQPRRVAAVSMAKRVGEELGQYSGKVSYQIRFESTTSKDTAIKFMTDGILLREISQDFALLNYSIIIIDEAHERSVNTDILIGMLSRIVDLRKKMSSEDSEVRPLKLVIMSATLRVSDFLKNSHLFPAALPPLIQAEGRQFPVTTHFARRTERDYLEEAFRKVSRGHRKLPPGGMLVFLTGQNEIKSLLKRLHDTFRSSNRSAVDSMRVQLSASEGPLEVDDLELGTAEDADIEEEDSEDEDSEDEDSEVDFVGHDGEDEDIAFDIGEPVTASLTVHILPLYSQLPTKEQLRVFEIPPDGSRLIVLATNVAETSLTIPGIRYVFDCGRSKERVYDQSTGVQKFEVNWISKASAEQRAGRAGRTGPGHCYRLYSSAVYERDFVEHTGPEILRTPIESLVLQMKTMGLDNVVNFPFPTAPERSSILRAEKLLKNLGALTPTGRVTQLGHRLSIYPLSPRFGKMLAIGAQHDCLPYVIALVSGLAEGDIFVPENQLELNPKERGEDEVYTNDDRLEDSAREQRQKNYNRARAIFSKNDPTSDALKLLSAVCAYAYAQDGDAFCRQMFLRSKALKEVSQLRKQLSDIVRANHPQSIGPYLSRLPTPSPKQLKALNQIVAAGFIDQVAIRADLAPNPPISPRKPQRAIDVPYLALSPSSTNTTSGTTSSDPAIYMHPSSILSPLSPKSLPQYLIYSHLQQSAPSLITSSSSSEKQQAGPKIRMFPLTAVSGAQLSALAHGTPLLEYWRGARTEGGVACPVAEEW
ncbi:hypothetical protein EPUS_04025 [Endocarpon pusillum Z07020]|uniref:RNA helicase n=1 Tax=Endocarpon pusillum (strain Z07020 / HMAS-L-300199) TaxID=1263415 RepID=U1HGP3_ENDPU|nr:uncharacterized protein EPUS_04025 [Endocarpon pusillum Z07020]ERF69320.1 hypothetical protein EPUS_04025 [Endocarpon pusillum Z07020]